MNSSSFVSAKPATVKTVIELTDEMSIAHLKKSYTFKKSAVALKAPAKIKATVNAEVRRVESAPEMAEAYIQESLSLELTEYYNPKKYSTLVKAGASELSVSGSLEAANGVVEKIDVTLPDGESIFVEYGEMMQNTFKYKTANGESARGVIYKLDANNYMVSLEDGPNAGTRMKFKNTTEADADYDQADHKIVEASIAATEKGFTF